MSESYSLLTATATARGTTYRLICVLDGGMLRILAPDIEPLRAARCWRSELLFAPDRAASGVLSDLHLPSGDLDGLTLALAHIAEQLRGAGGVGCCGPHESGDLDLTETCRA